MTYTTVQKRYSGSRPVIVAVCWEHDWLSLPEFAKEYESAIVADTSLGDRVEIKFFDNGDIDVAFVSKTRHRTYYADNWDAVGCWRSNIPDIPRHRKSLVAIARRFGIVVPMVRQDGAIPWGA